MKKLNVHFYLAAISAAGNFLFSFLGFLLAVSTADKKLIILGNIVFGAMGIAFFTFTLIAIGVAVKDMTAPSPQKISKEDEMISFLLGPLPQTSLNAN